MVPEIDLPGHTNAALASYPELAPRRRRAAAVHRHRGRLQLVVPADELTYDFLDDVLGELAALTPGPYLHIGGDEAFKVTGRRRTRDFVERAQQIVAGTARPWSAGTRSRPAAHVDGRVLQYWGTNGDDPATRRRRPPGRPA